MRIVIFASGSGSNAELLFRWAAETHDFSVQAVFCNRAEAGVLSRCSNWGIPSVVFDKNQMEQGGLQEQLMEFKPDLIVLAGFLWKFPSPLLEAMQGKVINLHPALLPNYGGKGMYGMHVHRAVCASTDTHSGITIHWVNPAYDEGIFLLQCSCPIPASRNPEELAHAIQGLEHYWLPRAVAFLAKAGLE
ncbi:MAG: formyltransferase family protein [Flavobacteriales bacterium]